MRYQSLSRKRWKAVRVLACGLLGLGAPLAGDASASRDAARWYSPAMAAQGAQLYSAHCASCHGAGGAGDGPVALAGMKVPTLDGTGHSTHHGLDDLLETVAKGSARGGLMPAFEQVLDADERRAVVAYIQSLWPDAAYQRWAAAQAQDSHQHGKAAGRSGAAE